MSCSFSWTDQCFLIILLLSILAILKNLRKQHVKRALRHIFQKPVAVSSAVILSFFLVVAILDSIHVDMDGDVTSTSFTNSVLDRVLSPLPNTFEQTYSAPLSLFLYSPEPVMINDSIQEVYPRLTYGFDCFSNDIAKTRWIIHVTWISSIISLTSTLGLLGLYLLYRRWRYAVWCSSPKKCLSSVEKATWFTFGISLFIAVTTFWLSRHLHVLGTGQIGQDIFYYAVKSIRTGLVIGILTTLFMMPLALLLGIGAGYFGKWFDDVVQYIYTTLSSIPGVLLITASVLSMQTYIANHPKQFSTLAKSADARLLALCIILGVTSWTTLCRLLRAEVLKLREIDFVLAAKSLGSSSFKIIVKHLMPNVMHIIVITLILDFSFLVLAEAVLSYVGVGVSPMTISWGNMINAARLELAREPVVWWPMTAAFLFMFTLVLAGNLFADVVRDALDPHRA